MIFREIDEPDDLIRSAGYFNGFFSNIYKKIIADKTDLCYNV